jgi:hypothetical protein
VSYEGELVEQGGIAFLPTAENPGKTFRATGTIQNGHYDLDSTRGPAPGSYRVEIFWHKKTGRKTPGENGRPKDETVQIIPGKYNVNSELTADVKPGRNTINFDLKN